MYEYNFKIRRKVNKEKHKAKYKFEISKYLNIIYHDATMDVFDNEFFNRDHLDIIPCLAIKEVNTQDTFPGTIALKQVKDDYLIIGYYLDIPSDMITMPILAEMIKSMWDEITTLNPTLSKVLGHDGINVFKYVSK